MLTFSQVIITMMCLLIGQPSLFNHHHCNYQSHTYCTVQTPKRTHHMTRTHDYSFSAERNGKPKESAISKIHMQFTLFSDYLFLSIMHACACTLAHCKISSISCLLSFSLWVLYLTITCNDRDITIMITAFAHAALSIHAHTNALADTHILYKS